MRGYDGWRWTSTSLFVVSLRAQCVRASVCVRVRACPSVRLQVQLEELKAREADAVRRARETKDGVDRLDQEKADIQRYVRVQPTFVVRIARITTKKRMSMRRRSPALSLPLA